MKRAMGSLYWRQFMLSAGMVLLTMVLLGVSFYALSYNYTVSEKRGEMRDRANLIAQLSVTYLVAGGETETTQEDALRALYAEDQPAFEAHIQTWPEDVRAYTCALAAPAFPKGDTHA